MVWCGFGFVVVLGVLFVCLLFVCLCFILMGPLTGLCIGPLPALLRLSTCRRPLHNSQFIFLLRLNVCNDLAKAMKALDGKKRNLVCRCMRWSGAPVRLPRLSEEPDASSEGGKSSLTSG